MVSQIFYLRVSAIHFAYRRLLQEGTYSGKTTCPVGAMGMGRNDNTSTSSFVEIVQRYKIIQSFDMLYTISV